jgi:hypothetical protein
MQRPPKTGENEYDFSYTVYLYIIFVFNSGGQIDNANR